MTIKIDWRIAQKQGKSTTQHNTPAKLCHCRLFFELFIFVLFSLKPPISFVMNSFVFVRPTRDSLPRESTESQRKRQKSINIYQIRFGLIFAFRFFTTQIVVLCVGSRHKSKRNWSLFELCWVPKIDDLARGPSWRSSQWDLEISLVNKTIFREVDANIESWCMEKRGSDIKT